jgi:putative DNA primase/helicase
MPGPVAGQLRRLRHVARPLGADGREAGVVISGVKVFIEGHGELRPGDAVRRGAWFTVAADQRDADYDAVFLRTEALVDAGADTITHTAVTTGDVPSRMLADRIRQTTFDFLRHVHPGTAGFLQLRAIREGDKRRPYIFIPLPLTADRMRDVQGFVQRHGATHNIYHGVATRPVDRSGVPDNLSELHALFVEIDLKTGVSLNDVWKRLGSFALQPSAVLHSGGGLHVYWLLSEPLDLATDLGFERADQWVGDLADRLGGDPASAEPARVLRVPDTFNHKPEYRSARPVVTLLNHGWDRRYSLAEVIAVLGDADPTQAASRRSRRDEPPIDHGTDRGTRMKLARAWLAQQPGAIEGTGGDVLTYRAACSVLVGYDNTEEDAFALLSEWNARCVPAWSPRELRQKIRNAARYHAGRRGAKLFEFEASEDGDARFFAEFYGDRVRFDHRQGRWLLVDDVGIWAPDRVERVVRLGADLMAERYRRATVLEDKRLRNWAHAGQQRKRLTNLLALARTVPPIADGGDRWDTDPMVLGVVNGVIDLTSGSLRLGRPEDRITMRARVAFDPAATCPLWEATVREIFGRDDDLVAYVRRALGYSLTGDTREECLWCCWGDGANGKSTLLNTFAHVVGDYADNLSSTALEQMQRNASGAATPEIAKLPGKRFVTASEFNDTSRFNEARVKVLTGQDQVTARHLYASEFTFTLSAKLWLATNAKPKVQDDTEAFWRRLLLVPFTQSFIGREDKTLKDRLRAEAAGILAWAVRGCLEWQRHGLGTPDAVRAATREYRDENDALTPFLDAYCVIAEGASVQAEPCYHAYRHWADVNRVSDRDRLSQRAFGERMKKRFPPAPARKRNVWYSGVGLGDWVSDRLQGRFFDEPAA